MGEEHNLNDIFDAAMEDAFWGDLTERDDTDESMNINPYEFDLDNLLEDETVDLLDVGVAYGNTASD